MVSKSFFEKYFINSVPCSFTYDGRKAVFGELKDLGGTREKRHYERVMADERFEAVLNIDVLHDGSAVEWWLDVSAPGVYDSDIIDDLKYCDFDLELPFINGGVCSKYPCIHWSKGSRASETDFQPQHENLWPFSDEPICFSCDNGRPSSGVMPYFNIQTGEDKGYIFAIGWSGQWNFSIHRRDTERRLSTIELTATMDRARFRVMSGEKLSLPRMLLLPWSDVDVEMSYNIFRRLMSKEMPTVDGHTVVPPICIATWGGAGAEEHKKILELIEEVGLDVDTYWIDAGWYGEGDEEDDNRYLEQWYYNVGNWHPIKHLYPNGMEEIGEAIDKAGMKFLLWFELERAVSRLNIVRDHREYFIGPKLPFNTVDFHEGARTRYSLMLNLGNEEARRYITDLLAWYIERAKMSWLRIDFNFEPLQYWRYGDSEDRWGVTEIKYVNGFYAMIDELRARFPGLAVDNCASGGRRLEYRMTRRAVPLFFTDYLCGVDRKLEAMQVENYAVSRWIPVHGAAAGSYTDDYGLRSHLCSTLSYGCDLPDEHIREHYKNYNRMTQHIRQIRGTMGKDIYLLTGLSIEKNAWFAYEAFDDDAEKGVVLAYRREDCADDSITVRLRGAIDPGADYIIEDVDRGERLIKGENLRESFTITIPERQGSALIIIRRADSLKNS